MPMDVLGSRVFVHYYTEAYSVTASEALATITGVNRGGTVTTTQLTVPTGKVFRVNQIVVTGVLLGATVTATHVRLRCNVSGAATATSPVLFTGRIGNNSIGTQAANYALPPLYYNFTEGLELPAGAGLQFTAIASTAAMHSLSMSLYGYERAV